jgi:hypothetical protein
MFGKFNIGSVHNFRKKLYNVRTVKLRVCMARKSSKKVPGGGSVFVFIKKMTSYAIEKETYLLHIVSPDLHTLMSSLF